MPRTTIQQSQLDIRPCDLAGLSTRFVNPGEREVLIALLRSVNPRAVIEFGCHVGSTSLAILRNIPSIQTFVGVDVPLSYVPTLPVQRQEVPRVPGELVLHDPRFHLIVMPHGSFDVTAEDLICCLSVKGPQTFDAVVIDGNHSRAGVLNDTKLARKVLRPGGIIIWHDDHGKPTVDVSAVLDEMGEAGTEIVHVEGTWWAYGMV